VADSETAREAIDEFIRRELGSLPRGDVASFRPSETERSSIEKIVTIFLFVQSDGINPTQLAYALSGPQGRASQRYRWMLTDVRDATVTVLRSRPLTGRVQVGQTSIWIPVFGDGTLWIAQGADGRVRLSARPDSAPGDGCGISSYISDDAELTSLPDQEARLIGQRAIDWAVRTYNSWRGPADAYLAEYAWRTELPEDRTLAYDSLLKAIPNPTLRHLP
jgi:hypothetical protein